MSVNNSKKKRQLASDDKLETKEKFQKTVAETSYDTYIIRGDNRSVFRVDSTKKSAVEMREFWKKHLKDGNLEKQGFFSFLFFDEWLNGTQEEYSDCSKCDGDDDYCDYAHPPSPHPREVSIRNIISKENGEFANWEKMDVPDGQLRYINWLSSNTFIFDQW